MFNKYGETRFQEWWEDHAKRPVAWAVMIVVGSALLAGAIALFMTLPRDVVIGLSIGCGIVFALLAFAWACCEVFS